MGDKFNGLLSLVKEYIVDVWEILKHKINYDIDSGPGQQFHSQSSVAEEQSGKLDHSCASDKNCRLCNSQVRDHVIVHLG